MLKLIFIPLSDAIFFSLNDGGRLKDIHGKVECFYDLRLRRFARKVQQTSTAFLVTKSELMKKHIISWRDSRKNELCQAWYLNVWLSWSRHEKMMRMNLKFTKLKNFLFLFSK